MMRLFKNYKTNMTDNYLYLPMTSICLKHIFIDVALRVMIFVSRFLKASVPKRNSFYVPL